jgi:hypothetical protein
VIEHPRHRRDRERCDRGESERVASTCFPRHQNSFQTSAGSREQWISAHTLKRDEHRRVPGITSTFDESHRRRAAPEYTARSDLSGDHPDRHPIRHAHERRAIFAEQQ